MAGPFKMKGSPMARNFGAPFKNDDVATRSDTVRAINMRKEWRLEGKSESQTDGEYEFITGAKKSRKILNETDKKTKDKNKTEEVLVKALRKSDAKKRRAKLTKKAVKGTKKNTTGVIRGDKD